MTKKAVTKTSPDRNAVLATIFSILSILVVYLIQHPQLLNLQLWPRYITLAVTIFGFSLLYLFQKKQHKSTINNALWRDPLFLCYGALSVVMLISLVNTINISEGLMDSSKYLLMFMFFGLSLVVYNNDKGYKIVSKVAVIVALGLLIWAFAQYIPRYLFNNNGGVRDMDDVRVNFVRSNQYIIGAFLLLPFILFQYLRKEKIWDVLTAIALYGNLFFIVAIQTRSVWAAMFLGFLMAGGAFLISGKKLISEEKRKLMIRKIVYIIGAAIIFFVVAEGMGRIFGNARSTVTDSVEKTFDSTKKFGAGSRLRRWDATMKLVKENPVLGEGAGDWKTVKYKYGLYDNSVTPHNDYLWVISDCGLIGFAFYMALFILAFIYLHRVWRKSDNEDDRIMALCLLFGLTGYMAIQFFTFPKKGISHQVMLTLFFVFSVILNSRVRKERKNIPQWLFSSVLVLFILITPIMVAFATVRLQSELAERIALKYRAQGDQKSVVKYMSEANNKWSNIDPFNHSIASYIAEGNYYQEKHTDAIKYYTQALRESPYNPNYWVNRAMAYSKLEMPEKSLKDIDMALKINPDYILALTNKSVIYFNRGDYDKASEILYTILEKKSRGKEAGKAYYMLGLVYINRNQINEACSYLQQAVDNNFPDAQQYLDAYCKNVNQ